MNFTGRKGAVRRILVLEIARNFRRPSAGCRLTFEYKCSNMKRQKDEKAIKAARDFYRYETVPHRVHFISFSCRNLMAITVAVSKSYVNFSESEIVHISDTVMESRMF